MYPFVAADTAPGPSNFHRQWTPNRIHEWIQSQAGPAANLPQNDASPAFSRACVSTGGRIRTLNLLIRSQVLYPIELRPHCSAVKAAIEG